MGYWGGGGGTKDMLAPLSNYWRGSEPPPPAPLFLRLCFICSYKIRSNPLDLLFSETFTACIISSNDIGTLISSLSTIGDYRLLPWNIILLKYSCAARTLTSQPVHFSLTFQLNYERMKLSHLCTAEYAARRDRLISGVLFSFRNF